MLKYLRNQRRNKDGLHDADEDHQCHGGDDVADFNTHRTTVDRRQCRKTPAPGLTMPTTRADGTRGNVRIKGSRRPQWCKNEGPAAPVHGHGE